jgi:glycosyltransferase involved in cell wall biosynthesis
MAHEEYVPASNIKNAVMSTWQRAQFWALGKTADAIGVSTSRWVEKFRSWFAPTPLYHLPVGSNIPYQGVDREKARAELDVDDLFVVGFFGSPQGSRHLEHVRSALRRLSCTADGQVQLLYIGSQGDALRRALPPEVTKESFRDAGQLPADEVSLRFSAMDLYIAPFVAGVSTRRGSFMTSLQHGVPTLATLGPQTDPIFREQDGDALRLVPEEDVAGFGAAAESLYRLPEPQRRDIGETGKELYETSFDWPVLARTAEEVFDAHSQMAYSRS